MGNYNSGRWGGRPLVEDGRTIDLMGMVRSGQVKDGSVGTGSLIWSLTDHMIDAVNYTYDLRNPEAAYLRLTSIWAPTDRDARRVVQRIALTHTPQNYGGRRWWALCPKSGQRVGKLHRPPGCCEFASREAWGLGYRSQRLARHDRPFAKLFRLQRKLGGKQLWGNEPSRPKGMWSQTYERHIERYRELDEGCGKEMMSLMRGLGVSV